MKSEYFKNNVKLSILLIVVISVILLYGVCLFPMEYGSDIMKIILFCGVVFILHPFLKVYIDWISFYIFSRENNLWDKRVQRPRIFIYIIYFWILYFIVSSDMDGYYTLMANRFFLLLYLLIGAYFVGWLIWTGNFESVILSRIEKNVNNNITIDKLDSKEIITAKKEKKKLNAQYDNRKGMDDAIVRKIYDLLLQYQYISDDMKWEEFFQKFLREPIVLDMGVPSFRYFYNLLFDKFKIRRIKHKEFGSLFIKKLDNSPYDIEQFRKEKNPLPKDRHVLDEIFNKIMN